MNKALFFILFTALLVAWPIKRAAAKTITIAVIDTGVDRSVPHLCKFGHKSFAPQNSDPLADPVGHGTHIAGIIVDNAGEGAFCIVSIKFYDPNETKSQTIKAMVKAINYAVNIKVDFINISGGGPEANNKEYSSVERALKAKTTLVVAAGNDSEDLSQDCDFFPACYDTRLVVVGNLKNADMPYDYDQPNRSPSSNYGNRVTRWEVGTNVLSTLPGGVMGRRSGTSQATAVATGKLVKERLSNNAVK